jgi:outer membrane protein assembly factor BamB
MKTTTIGIIILALVIISLSTFGTTHAYFTSKQVTGPHLVSTWQSLSWILTTQADFLAGFPVNVNTSASPGDVILDNQTIAPSIFATTGSSANFLMYNVSNDTWVKRANTLATVGAGGGARYVGLGNISALRGAGTTTFWIYNISTNTWLVKAVTSGAVNTGGTLSDYIGAGNISALRGTNTATFWIYNISNNAWSAKANAPGNVGAGGALAYDNGKYVYAFNGTNTRNFWRYNISGNSWSSLANTPGNVGTGGAVAYDNGNFIYAFNGTNTRNFWRYSISGNSWSTLSNIPGNVGAGGSLVSDKGNYIYAFNGTSKPSFWRYDIFSNSWSDNAVANPALNVGAGGSLTYVAGSSLYKSLGTLASPVYDTGNSAMRWDSLLWDSAALAETNITFEVRASDILFTKTDASPAWQQSGWPSPVNSGLPSGRYLQWRATLSTGNSSRTPILNEVRVSYS